jgi:uncharacterized protein with ParB-like and HNH nuclease domain
VLLLNTSDTWYENDFDEYEEDVPIKEYDITSTPNDFNISTIYNLMDNGVIKIPPFQRNYVWDQKRASKLIESIILGLPIPQVFLYEKGKNDFLIIDGQQRLLSIYFFVKERFPTQPGRKKIREFLTGQETIDQSILSNDRYFTNFSLKLPAPISSEKNKYDKLKYHTLGEEKHTFDYLRTIRSVVIKQNEPDDDSSMYEIFNRLNSGGQNLKPQEIRLSLYYSDFYKMLFKVNDEKKWRAMLGQPSADLNFKDIEILVRSFAMLFLNDEYKAPMTKFLNRFSKIGEKFTHEEIDYLEKLFISFLNSCDDLSNKIFYSTNNKFNISLFESTFVAACSSYFFDRKILEGKIDEESILKLKGDSEFIHATQSGVASRSSVKTRMNRAKILIKIE